MKTYVKIQSKEQSSQYVDFVMEHDIPVHSIKMIFTDLTKYRVILRDSKHWKGNTITYHEAFKIIRNIKFYKKVREIKKHYIFKPIAKFYTNNFAKLCYREAYNVTFFNDCKISSLLEIIDEPIKIAVSRSPYVYGHYEMIKKDNRYWLGKIIEEYTIESEKNVEID